MHINKNSKGDSLTRFKKLTDAGSVRRVGDGALIKSIRSKSYKSVYGRPPRRQREAQK